MSHNEEEFAQIFNEVYPRLCQFLEYMLGRDNGAQDIAQESMLRLFHFGINKLSRDEARFWLFRVARNLACNEVNRRQTRVKFFHKIAAIFRITTPNPERELEQTETIDHLSNLLTSLPPDQRTALLLREQEEMSYRDIANLMGVSESKVKIDIFRARETLRAKWKGGE